MANFETLNSGEWSEVYAFLKLLSSGYLQGCDEYLNLIDDFVEIISLSTESNCSHQKLEYLVKNGVVVIRENNIEKGSFSTLKFSEYAKIVFCKILENKRRTFCIEELSDFFYLIGQPKRKTKSGSKKDLSLNIIEPTLNKVVNFGFSIKSNLAGNSTLVNASTATNIIYNVNISPNDVKKYPYKTKSLLACLGDVDLVFDGFANEVFFHNLQLIDTQLPVMIAKMLLAYFQKKGRTILQLLEVIKNENPLNLVDREIYSIKIGEFLLAMALGMVPNTRWNKCFDADGGLIVVKKNGDLASFYIFKCGFMKRLVTYLLNNSYLDTPSTSRHKFGSLYIEDGKVKLNLNLQVRLGAK